MSCSKISLCCSYKLDQLLWGERQLKVSRCYSILILHKNIYLTEILYFKLRLKQTHLSDIFYFTSGTLIILINETNCYKNQKNSNHVLIELANMYLVQMYLIIPVWETFVGQKFTKENHNNLECHNIIFRIPFCFISKLQWTYVNAIYFVKLHVSAKN